MATVYLHIGTPKTGTTALQNFLPANRELLEKNGICYADLGYQYPGIGKYRNAHFLVAAQFDENKKRMYEKEREDWENGLDAVQRLAADFPRIILSDEGIWQGSQNRENFWADLREGFAKRGLEVRIIVYFRRQDLWVQSHWAQKVKEGASFGFQEYLQSPVYLNYPLDYYQYMSMLAGLFGKEALIIRVYEKEQYRGAEQNIYSDFLDIFGLRLSDGFAVEQAVYNTSLGGNYLELRRRLNVNPKLRSNTNIISKSIKAVQDEKAADGSLREAAYFAPGQVFEFLKKYEESNASVAREFLGREDGRLFCAQVKDVPKVTYSDAELLDDLIEICAKVCERANEDAKKAKRELENARRNSGLIGGAKRLAKKIVGK